MKQTNNYLHYLKDEVIGYWELISDEEFWLHMLVLLFILTFPVSLLVLALIRFVYDRMGK
ncbi:hypothetical protein [Xenorhabdus szentirmaii]|uniref:Uncharacterized protein n=1 Tax=Xenorhabdus szentirmaii DSM 16338 TaxID=1427518 RepID=W1J4U6_9GAMM|nr:hypothetical protein [Xenorhabdus szentirmaii]PHM32105.1 hypothetical protein Xsze_02835 [Xenorhabdus szentirmaii DSM 16338]PHM41603.1 hypothetical protein Xszus_01296 [Xenorhabdus szentirmaii]CDL84876.1 hypothetical protein XSR1_550027 [Xenorhabdus szentirmaii DSM 16338]